MKYINHKRLRKVLNLDDIEAANEYINTLSEADRAKYIDDNGQLWSELRGEMWRLGGHKCWYSEAFIQEQSGHIEHFRPKKRLHGLEKGQRHNGYWWRAFDWENFRLAHPTCNVRVTDYLSGKKVGKGSYFPLKDESMRAIDKAGELHETPVLLDPCKSGDSELICYRLDSGKPIASVQPVNGGFSSEQDEWDHYRAVQTIEYFHLDEGTWNTDRKDLIDEVVVLCDLIIKEKNKKPIDQPEYRRLIAELTNYLEKHEPFISVVEQVLKEKCLLI